MLVDSQNICKKTAFYKYRRNIVFVFRQSRTTTLNVFRTVLVQTPLCYTLSIFFYSYSIMSTTFVVADFRRAFYRFIVLPLRTCKIGFIVFSSMQQRRIARKTKRQRPLSVQLLTSLMDDKLTVY